MRIDGIHLYFRTTKADANTIRVYTKSDIYLGRINLADRVYIPPTSSYIELNWSILGEIAKYIEVHGMV